VKNDRKKPADQSKPADQEKPAEAKKPAEHPKPPEQKKPAEQKIKTDPIVSIGMPHSGDQVKTIVNCQGKAGPNDDVQLTLDFTPRGATTATTKNVSVRALPDGTWTTGIVGAESEPNSGTLRAFKSSPTDDSSRNRLTLTETPIIGEFRGDVIEAFRKAGARVETGSYDPKKGSQVICMLTPVSDDTWQLMFPPVIAIAGTWITAFRNPAAKGPPYTLWAFLVDFEGNVVAQHTRIIT